MKKVEWKKEDYPLYYGITADELLSVLLKENGYKQFGDVPQPLLDTTERYPTKEFEQMRMEDYIRHHQKGNQQGVARKRLQRVE